MWIRITLALILAVTAGHDLLAADWMLRLKLDGQPIEGLPLRATKRRVDLLARDGHWWDFPPGKAKEFSKVQAAFRAYSQAEMRGQLLREFGRRYEVSGTGNYLVVHPRGGRDKWAQRFEDLYRSYAHYFTARGLRPTRPQFPLVAVVFPTQAELQQYARQQGSPIPSGFLGVYSWKTNRILMYDLTATRGNEQLWHVNAETIIHEAAHQIAFNCGHHNRFSPPPRWQCEGLATMFEAPGVWDSRHFAHQPDRVNATQLKVFRQAENRREKGDLAQLVSSDRLFRNDTGRFYAESWALTFFLMETRPRQYVQYLQKTATRPNFSALTTPERIAEFTSVFGRDLEMLEARFHRFMRGL